MRIGGLASGIDTESIVNDLMKAERIPLDKVTQKKQFFEWQLNDYRAANRGLKEFSENLFDNMILGKKFSQKDVSISSPNDVSIKSVGNSDNFSGTISVQQLATNANLKGQAIHEDNKVLKQGGTISITAPGGKGAIDIELAKGDTMKDVVKKINEKADVRAFYDDDTGRIGITAKQSGGDAILDSNGDVSSASSSSYIQITDKEGTLTETLGLSSTGNLGKPGMNSKFTYNGMDLERGSNNFTLDGMEITLKEANDKNITFNTTTDTEAVFETVTKFVDDYNSLIEDLNKKIRESTYRDFQPLSSEQKKDMTDKEIELWEEKAMSGTLRNNPEITSLLTTMRNVLTRSVKIGETGTGSDTKDVSISLHSIGISTSKNYLDNGKLVIDEKKLKEAITKNPADVEKLFVGNGEDPKEKGIVVQLRTEVNITQKALQRKAGSAGDTNQAFTLGRTLENMNKQIDRFENRLKMTEARYWKQFNAMENAIQRANAQSASLMSSFGGGM